MWGAEFFPDGLAAADVVGVGGADEVGVGDLEALDEVAELSGVLVGVGLGGETGLGGFAEDFVAVLVGTDLEADFVALAATEAGVGVGEQVIHGVADVGVTVDVGDCSSDISFGHGDIITRTGGESEGAGEAGRSKNPAEGLGLFAMVMVTTRQCRWRRLELGWFRGRRESWRRGCRRWNQRVGFRRHRWSENHLQTGGRPT